MAIGHKNTIRRPTFEELLLIEFLAKKAKYHSPTNGNRAYGLNPPRMIKLDRLQ